ncbi:MAG: GDSL-type esterase/lipase family protein [Planctomycetota bacterium]
MPPPPTPRSRSRSLARALAVSVSVALGLLAAEFVFRAHLRSEYASALAAWTNDLYRLLPPGRYYGCLPNLAYQATIPQETGPLRLTYHTDADGWRIQPRATATPQTRRVLCLGDSYTFGLAVADDQTYPCHLQGLLRARGLDVEVFNRGVPGYNTVQEHDTLIEVFDTVSPHVVLLGYVMNDAEPVMTVPLSPDLRFEDCRSWLLEVVRPKINAVARWLVADQPLCSARQAELVLDYRESFAPNSRKWRRSRDALSAIHAFLRVRGVPLLVFIQPAFTERFDDTYRFFLLHERVAEWGERGGYPTFDLLPLFWGEQRADLWVEGDGHPGGAAQRRMAVAMADQVEPLLR